MTAEPDHSRRSAAWALLSSNTSYLLLWSGQFVSGIGDRVAQVAIIWWIIEVTGRPELLAVAMVSATLGTVLVGPFAGILADRFHRVKMLVSIDVLRSGLMVVLACLEWTGMLSLPILYVIMALMGMAEAGFTPTAAALVPSLVPRKQLVEANALLRTGINLALVIGYFLGGVLLAAVGIAGALLVNGAALLLSALWEAFIKAPPPDPQPRASVLSDLAEGFRFVAGHRLILSMFLTFAFLNFFTTPLSQVLIPSVVSQTLDLGEVHLTTAMGILMGGILFSALLLSLVGHRITRKSGPILISLGLIGLGMATMGLSVSGLVLGIAGAAVAYVLFVAMGFVTGAAAGGAQINIDVFMQETVPDAKRGRVFALTNTLALGVRPLAGLAVGLLLVVASPWIILVVYGAAIVGGTLYLSTVRGMRDI